MLKGDKGWAASCGQAHRAALTGCLDALHWVQCQGIRVVEQQQGMQTKDCEVCRCSAQLWCECMRHHTQHAWYLGNRWMHAPHCSSPPQHTASLLHSQPLNPTHPCNFQIPFVEDVTLGTRNMADKELYHPAAEWVKGKVSLAPMGSLRNGRLCCGHACFHERSSCAYVNCTARQGLVCAACCEEDCPSPCFWTKKLSLLATKAQSSC